MLAKKWDPLVAKDILIGDGSEKKPKNGVAVVLWAMGKFHVSQIAGRNPAAQTSP